MSRLADSGAALAAPAEAAMREALAETILESTADAIIAVDGAGVVRSFNRSAERTFRCRAEDMVGVSAGELPTVLPNLVNYNPSTWNLGFV